MRRWLLVEGWGRSNLGAPVAISTVALFEADAVGGEARPVLSFLFFNRKGPSFVSLTQLIVHS